MLIDKVFGGYLAVRRISNEPKIPRGRETGAAPVIVDRLFRRNTAGLGEFRRRQAIEAEIFVQRHGKQ
nr:hypothetical protein [uncultured Rhodopila sp.]